MRFTDELYNNMIVFKLNIHTYTFYFEPFKQTYYIRCFGNFAF